MIKDDAPVGAIVVAWPDPGDVPQRQADLLKTFADQAAIAIENARLIGETREALEQQTATAAILQVISGSITDAQPVFDAIVRSCRRLFECESAGIAMVGDDQWIRLAAYSGELREQVGRAYPVPFRGSAMEAAFREGRVMHYPDVLADPGVPANLRRVHEQIGKGSATQMMAPMLWDGRGVGVINVSRRPPRPSDSPKAIRNVQRC